MWLNFLEFNRQQEAVKCTGQEIYTHCILNTADSGCCLKSLAFSSLSARLHIAPRLLYLLLRSDSCPHHI